MRREVYNIKNGHLENSQIKLSKKENTPTRATANKKKDYIFPYPQCSQQMIGSSMLEFFRWLRRLLSTSTCLNLFPISFFSLLFLLLLHGIGPFLTHQHLTFQIFFFFRFHPPVNTMQRIKTRKKNLNIISEHGEEGKTQDK